MLLPPDIAWLRVHAASDQVAAAHAEVRAQVPPEAWPAIEQLMDAYGELLVQTLRAAVQEAERER